MSLLGSSARPAAYGKLPLARDFVWLGTERGGVARLRALVDGSATAVLRAADRGIERIQAIDVSSGGPGAVITLWPSTDAGGLRRFPFSQRSELSARDLARGVHALAEDMHAGHEALVAQARRCTDLADLERWYEALPLAEAAGGAEPGEDRVAVGPWLTDIFAGDQLSTALWRLRLLVRAGGGSLKRSIGSKHALVLPLAPTESAAVQADRWLNLLAPALGGALASTVTASPAWPRLVVALGPLTAAHLALVASSNAAAVDLTDRRMPADLDGHSAFDQALRRIVAEERPADSRLARLLAGTEPLDGETQ